MHQSQSELMLQSCLVLFRSVDLAEPADATNQLGQRTAEDDYTQDRGSVQVRDIWRSAFFQDVTRHQTAQDIL
jgi:hypothetical protein